MNDNNKNVFKFKMPNDKEEATIEVGVSQKFEIDLYGNITTGFNWFLENGNENNLYVKPLNLSENKTGEYFKGNHPPGWRGGGGSLHFQFEATAVGIHDLKFVYKRSWCNDVAAELSVKVKVTAS